MGNYKVRVSENIGSKSEEAFGGVGTEIEIQKGNWYDEFIDRNNYKWCLFKGFKELQTMLDSDFSANYRTKFELIEE